MKAFKNIAIVLAAGKSSRIGGKTKKQYAVINGKKLYQYSLEKFLENKFIDKVVLVISEEDFSKESNYIFSQKDYSTKTQDKIIVVSGGTERYDSVYNAIIAINEFLNIDSQCNILIHDSARVFIESKEIQKCINALKKYKAISLAKKCTDTIKLSNNNINRKKVLSKVDKVHEVKQTLNRDELFAVQTPQCFKWNVIKKAYDNLYYDMSKNKIDLSITDDCMIVENFSKEKVYLIETNTYNEKITYKKDLEEVQKNGI